MITPGPEVASSWSLASCGDAAWGGSPVVTDSLGTFETVAGNHVEDMAEVDQGMFADTGEAYLVSVVEACNKVWSPVGPG